MDKTPVVRRLTFIGLMLLLITTALPITSHAAQQRNGNCATYPWGGGAGSGTSADPYKIASQGDLAEMQFCLDKSFQLMADIRLIGEWTPVGTGGVGATPFTGTFDGNGFTIYDLTNTSAAGHIGLFGATDGATISNATLSGVTVTGADPTNTEFIGGLVGEASATVIRNCRISGTLTGRGYIGGVAGYLTDSSVIENCSTSGSIGDQNSLYYIGGAVGFVFESTIQDSSSSATISASVVNGASVGGLVGSIMNTQYTSGISRSSATGDVFGLQRIGGLIGDVSADDGDVEIRQSFATGNVRNSDTPDGNSYEFGGLIGSMETQSGSVTISQSFATGSVDTYQQGGGFIGRTGTRHGRPGSIIIEDTFASGNVSTANGVAGGFGGFVDREIGTTFELRNSYARGSVTDPVTSGGFTASGTADSFTSSFWNPSDSAPATTSLAGTMSTRDQMRGVDLYKNAGWKIANGWEPVGTNVWGICPEVNSGYPFLLAFYPSNPCAVAPTPTPTPTPSVKQAQELKQPLVLPKRISRTKPTVLLRSWQYTNADQRALPRITFKLPASLVSIGDSKLGRYTVSKSGRVKLWVYTSLPVRVIFKLWAPATDDFTKFTFQKTYRIAK